MDWTKDKLQSLVDSAADHYGVPRPLAHAIVEQESAWNIKASSGKAHGIMQLAPATAAELGVKDIYDPVQNIDGGMRYLKQQLDDFGRVDLALAAYNAGPNAVNRYRGVPPYEETQGYVAKILKKAGNFVMPTAGAAELDSVPKTIKVRDKQTGEVYEADWETGARVTPKTIKVRDKQTGEVYEADWETGQRISEPAPEVDNTAIKEGLRRQTDVLLNKGGVNKDTRRMALQTAGGLAGGAIGTGIAPVLGTAAGGAIGTAAGGAIDDLLRMREGEAVPQPQSALRNVQTGLASEAAGAVAAPVIGKVSDVAGKAVGRMLGVTDDAARLIKDYEPTGMTPTVGQIAPRGAKLIQESAAQMPGGAGVMDAYTKQHSEKLGALAQKIVAKGRVLEPGSTPAGEAIGRGAAKTEAFHSQSEGIMRRAWTRLPAAQAPAVTTRTQQAIEDILINTPARTVEEIKSGPSVERLWEIRKELDLHTDFAKPGQKAILRKAITGDIEESLKASGGKEALSRWRDYQQFYKAQKPERDLVDALKAKDPDAAYRWSMQSAANLARAKQLSDPDEWAALRAEKARQMGLARNHQQDASLEKFDVNTFLTNYAQFAKDDPSKAKLLFGDIDKDLQGLLRIADSVKDLSSVKNTSGTAAIWNTISGIAGVSTAIATGNPAAAGAAAAAPAAAGWGIAKAMTSPTFVKWLAGVPRGPITPDTLSRHIAKLSVLEFEDEATKNFAGELYRVLSQ